MLKTPLTDLAGWTRHFAAYDIPVMRGTVDAIAKLRADERTKNFFKL